MHRIFRWEIILVLINAISYSLYLILVKPLTVKISSFHPYEMAVSNGGCGKSTHYPQPVSRSGMDLPAHARDLENGFVVVGTTFLTYLLNVFALRQLSAATISAFIYLQPLIAIIYAVATGADSLDMYENCGALLVFAGVYMVTRKKPQPVSIDRLLRHLLGLLPYFRVSLW